MAPLVGATELNPLPDPTQGIKNAFALRAMGQEAQLRHEQITGAQQENQQRQIQLQDTQAMSAAMHDWDGKDINALPPLILKHNGSANAVFGMKQKILEQQQTYSTIAKNDSETGSKNLETIQKKNDMLLGALNGVTSGPDEGIGQRLTDAIGSASQQGLIDPQHAQSVMQMAQLDPQSLRKQLSIFEKGFQGNAAQIEQAKNEATTFEAQQRGEQIQRGGTPEMQKAKYTTILAKIKAGQPLMDGDLSFAQAYEAGEAKTTTQSDTLGVTSTTTSKPSGLASVSGRTAGAGAGSIQPSAKDSIVDMVGQYKLNPMMLQRMIIKHPEVIAAVGQKYPDFDQTNYQAKAKAMESFTSGPYSRQINATNVALDHLGVLGDAVDGLKNNDIKVLNRIANSFGLQTGNSAVTVFNTIAHKLAPELAQAYIQGGGGEGERSQIQKDYDASLGPDQLKNNLAITARLLQPNIETIQQQYKNTIGRDDFQQRFLTPGAQKSMQRFSPQQGGQQHAPGAQANLPEGTTGKGSDNKPYIVKGGVWVPQQ